MLSLFARLKWLRLDSHFPRQWHAAIGARNGWLAQWRACSGQASAILPENQAAAGGDRLEVASFPDSRTFRNHMQPSPVLKSHCSYIR